MFLFLVLLLGVSWGQFIPPFTNFNASASGTGYIISGFAYESDLPSNPVPITLIIDTPGQRIGYFLGTAGGNYITTANATYAWNIPNAGGFCFKYAGWTYSQQVANMNSMLSVPFSTPLLSQYIGQFTDLASCYQRLSYSYYQTGNYVTRIDFVQPFPTAYGCLPITGSYFFDLRTLDTRSSRDPYFVLPANCATPVDFCSVAYPTCSVCAAGCTTSCCSSRK